MKASKERNSREGDEKWKGGRQEGMDGGRGV